MKSPGNLSEDLNRQRVRSGRGVGHDRQRVDVSSDNGALSTAWTNEIAMEVPETGLPSGHPQRTIKTYRFSVEHLILDDVTHEGRVFLRLAEALRKRHGIPKGILDVLGQ
jgi:hypothetical protein